MKKFLISFLLIASPVSAQNKFAIIYWTSTSTVAPPNITGTFQGYTDYYYKESYNKIGPFTWVSYGPYLSHPEVSCTNNNSVNTLAVGDGFNPTNYRYTVYVNPDCAPQYFEGHGLLPLTADGGGHSNYFLGAYAFGDQGDTTGGLVCQDTKGNYYTFAGPGITCVQNTWLEWGPSPWGWNNQEDQAVYVKQNNGWLTSNDVKTVDAGTYTIGALETSLTDVKGLIFGNYSIEYRQARGLNVRVNNQLVDASPDGLFGMNGGGSSAMSVGQTLYDGPNQTSITLISQTTTSATVKIAFDILPCVPANPTISVNSPQSGAAGGNVNFSVVITNNDSVGCASDIFALSYFTLQPVIPSITLSPSQTNTIPVQVTSFTPGGTYSIPFTVYNTATPSFTNSVIGIANLATSTSSANFIKLDNVTLGNWQGVYGVDGYQMPTNIASHTGLDTKLPSYAKLVITNTNGWIYEAGPYDYDTTILVSPFDGHRWATGWYSQSVMSFDLDFTDGGAHQVSLYGTNGGCVSGAIAAHVNIVDATNSSIVLDARDLLTHQYSVWNISGHVAINFLIAPCGAEVAGIFFK